MARVDKLAGFPALMLNGQEVFPKENDQAKQCPHKEHVDRYIEELMNQPVNMGIFAPVSEPFDRSSGTQILFSLDSKGGFMAA